MVRTWSLHGPNMNQKLLWYGPNMAQTWSEHGPNMVRTWSKHGPNMVPENKEFIGMGFIHRFLQLEYMLLITENSL